MSNSARDSISLYIVEEQQVLKEAYLSLLLQQPDIEVLGASEDVTQDGLLEVAKALHPDVMLLGFKTFEQAMVERLAAVREACPGVATVVLSLRYDAGSLRALRELSAPASVGCAYLLKHTLDTVEQLVQVIHSVAEGRIIVDPPIMKGLMATDRQEALLIKRLTPRELEVLRLMAKGCRNNAIAELLCLEPKTVERHINNIYGKMGSLSDSRHPRVHAIMLYLTAVGQLFADEDDQQQDLDHEPPLEQALRRARVA